MSKKQSKPAPKSKNAVAAMLMGGAKPQTHQQKMTQKSKQARRSQAIGKGLCGG